MLIGTSILRLVWAVVEEASPGDLLTLSDRMLVKRLSQNVTQKILLSDEEICSLDGYLDSKVLLIRDIAESRVTQKSVALSSLESTEALEITA